MTNPATRKRAARGYHADRKEAQRRGAQQRQPAVFEDIVERNEEQETDAETEERQGHEKSGAARRYPQRLADETGERLA